MFHIHLVFMLICQGQSDFPEHPILFYFLWLTCLVRVTLGLCCRAQAFSSCREPGLPFIGVHRLLTVVTSLGAEWMLWVLGFSSFSRKQWLPGSRASGFQLLRHKGSLVVALGPGAGQPPELWCTSLVALLHVASSRTGAQTCVPCIGRQILTLSPTNEIPVSFYFLKVQK